MLLALVLVTAACLVAAWHEVGMGIVPLVTGIGNIFGFLAKAVPPQFTGFAGFHHTASLALQTVAIAVVGTAIAVVLSIPVGFCAARNTTPHPAARWAARAVITMCRSIPDLIFAIIFVEALGLGGLPGALALGVHSVGMLGKLFAETIEQVGPQPREAVAATGAGRIQNLTSTVVPQVLPSFASNTIYRLDINLRSSVILGYVGAGGIGLALNAAMGELLFRQATAIVIVIFALIVVMEVASAAIRSSLVGTDAQVGRASRPSLIGDQLAAKMRLGRRTPTASHPQEISFNTHSLRPPWTRDRARRYGFLVGAVVVVVLSMWDAKISPLKLITSTVKLYGTFSKYFPPDFSKGHIVTATLQSASVALVATVLGAAIAIPVGLAAARNISDRWLYRAARVFLLIARAVPELVLAIVFVVAVGLGLEAGTFALIVGTIAFLAKLVAESVEETPAAPREAVLSTGATRWQETATSVVTPSVPSLVGQSLYMLDVNFRSSTILGMVGAGGIGYLLQQSIQVLDYRATGAIFVSTFVVVLLLEILTNAIRRQLL